MVSDRDFNDLIAQVNKKFVQLDATVAKLREELAALKKDDKKEKPNKKS